MESIRTTLSENGRLVLPAALRKALGLQPGEVVLVVDGDTLRIANARSAVSEAQELVRKHIGGNDFLSEALIAQRRTEAARE